MNSTLLRTVPPFAAVFLFGLLYLLLVAVGFLEARFGWLDGYNAEGAKAILILSSGLVYGGMRAWFCFPLSDQSFYKWFKTTPWRPGMPMPFGFMYMHLNWADAIAPSILLLIEWNNPYINATWMLTVFLVGYLAVHMPMFDWSKDHFLNYLMAFGFGLFVWVLQYSKWAVLVLVGMYFIAVWGHRRVLAGFPWTGEQKPEKYGEKKVIGQSKDYGAEIGKTYPVARQANQMKTYLEVLSPARPAEISVGHAIATALVIGWCFFVVFDIAFQATNRFVPVYAGIEKVTKGIFVMFAVTAALARIVIYIHAAKPPLGFLERLFTGKLVIPKYDIVLVAPVVWSALGMLMFFGLAKSGVYVPLSFAIGISSIVASMLLMKPSQIEWRLTGHNSPRVLLTTIDKAAKVSM